MISKNDTACSFHKSSVLIWTVSGLSRHSTCLDIKRGDDWIFVNGGVDRFCIKNAFRNVPKGIFDKTLGSGAILIYKIAKSFQYDGVNST